MGTPFKLSFPYHCHKWAWLYGKHILVGMRVPLLGVPLVFLENMANKWVSSQYIIIFIYVKFQGCASDRIHALYNSLHLVDFQCWWKSSSHMDPMGMKSTQQTCGNDTVAGHPKPFPGKRTRAAFERQHPCDFSMVHWVDAFCCWWSNQPIWKNMRRSNWIISQQVGVKIKRWNHHLVLL